jgi:hypothetical protein
VKERKGGQERRGGEGAQGRVRGAHFFVTKMTSNLVIRSLYEHLHSGQKVVMSGKTIILLGFLWFFGNFSFFNKFFKLQFVSVHWLQFEKRDYSNLPKAGIEMDKIFNQHLNMSQCHICQKAKYSNLKTLRDNIKNVKNLSWKFV